MANEWTPTRAARLGYLVGTLVPIERIAAEFGVTERAVWDKINRYGLSFHEAYWARHPGQAVPPVERARDGAAGRRN